MQEVHPYDIGQFHQHPQKWVVVLAVATFLAVAFGAASAQQTSDIRAADPELTRLIDRLEKSMSRSLSPDEIRELLERVDARRAQDEKCVSQLEQEEKLMLQAGIPESGDVATPNLDEVHKRLFSCRINQARMTDWRRRLEVRLVKSRGADLLVADQGWSVSTWADNVPAATMVSIFLALALLIRSAWVRAFVALATMTTLIFLSYRWSLVVFWLALPLLPLVPALARISLPARITLAFHLAGVYLWWIGVASLRDPEWTRWSAIGVSVAAAGLVLFAIMTQRSMSGISRFLTVLAGVVGGAALVSAILLRLDLASFLLLGIMGTTYGWYLLSILRHAVRRMLEKQTPGADTTAPAWLTSARLGTDLALLIGYLWVLALAWQSDRFGLESPIALFTDGFPVGGFQVSPLNIALALAAYFAIIALFSHSRTWLGNNLAKEGIHRERGVELLALVLRYAGLVVAVLVALAVAGVDISNLALVAGALSVGIGFGLQNVVNNFVSGIILAFERPIRVGDWVRLEGVEGTVRRIRVRSTVIETFDRADVIVPNSDLISSTVTNLTLGNAIGRLTIKVGVAYGSDLQLVRRLLQDIVADESRVLKEPEPRIVFWEFGDSSLNFEIRCFLSDVLNIVDVRNALNLAIDAAFREHGIVIPFPQRDVHLLGEPETKRPEEEER